jgi:hypothetical protein
MLDCAIIVEDQVTIYGIVRPRRGTTMDPEIEGEVGLVGIREVVDLIEIEGGDSAGTKVIPTENKEEDSPTEIREEEQGKCRLP